METIGAAPFGQLLLTALTLVEGVLGVTAIFRNHQTEDQFISVVESQCRRRTGSSIFVAVIAQAVLRLAAKAAF